MFTALTLSMALGAPIPAPSDPVPVGVAPQVMELKAGADGKVVVTVRRTEKVPVNVARPVNPGNAPGGVAPAVIRQRIVTKQANRILMPTINEAAFCLMEGVGTAESIDTVMKLGMNHPMGPLALADFIGLDTCVAILEVMHAGLGDPKYRPCPLLRKYVAAGWLGKKSGRGFYTY